MPQKAKKQQSSTGAKKRVDAERSEIAAIINEHAAPDTSHRRKRMSSEQRFEQIVDAAVKVIARKGYYGMSIQDVANEIGISQTAIIHHVKNKRGLLIAVIERHYDRADAVKTYMDQFNPGGPRAGELPKIPEALRCVVQQNAEQPELVKVFETLNTEAMSPEHPAYAYFAQRPQRMIETFRQHEWAVPDGVDGEFVYMLANATMYGLEGRWLANQKSIDFLKEWDRYADYLFPLPQWEGCR
ncbi:TetR/AcrR family transcriptional regulator [Bifidobacterium sp. ESL0732]|uniref:TetR/AcrR family transcriptional regulator n=1 Tax=Bifidobacterium sp. ESL0732 TaxID=2983222 RepID=UPI0023F84E34|nr:TetR/AcrR family transcriptional regulator [Bifidobacterium sp. ESL0732]WEV64834.1 TetR/AcrR family transcriptional regulator [Bifidobacterium sp. ESL0732]